MAKNYRLSSSIALTLIMALVLLLTKPAIISAHAPTEPTNTAATNSTTNYHEVPLSERAKNVLISYGENPANFKAYMPEVLISDDSSEAQAIEPTSIIGTIVIFLAGAVAGYIIDGVVIAASGQSAADWVADAIRWTSKGLSNVVKMFVSPTKVLYTTDSNNCIQRRPGGEFLCPW